MSFWESVILGIVQGLTEFLPISSSAHLRIVGDLMGADPGAAFTAITQIGTETAVLLYFRRDIIRIVSAWCRALVGRLPRNDPDAMMGWYIIVGSIPIVVIGVTFQDEIDHALRNLYITVAMLVIFGLLLGWADKIGEKRRRLEELNWKDAALFGCAQALAVIPGVSRSGGTITAGLLMGYTRRAAARYSFLLAIPAVLGSGFFKLFGSIGDPGSLPGAGATLVATIVAFVIGYLVIIAFLKIVETYSYKPFVYYRLGLAALTVILLLTGAVTATPTS